MFTRSQFFSNMETRKCHTDDEKLEHRIESLEAYIHFIKASDKNEVFFQLELLKTLLQLKEEKRHSVIANQKLEIVEKELSELRELFHHHVNAAGTWNMNKIALDTKTTCPSTQQEPTQVSTQVSTQEPTQAPTQTSIQQDELNRLETLMSVMLKYYDLFKNDPTLADAMANLRTRMDTYEKRKTELLQQSK